MKLIEDEDNDWHTVQPRGVWLEDYTTSDSALEVGGVHSVDQLTRPEDELEEEEEEVAEDRVIFLDALKGL
jgi:hypothetical protein